MLKIMGKKIFTILHLKFFVYLNLWVNKSFVMPCRKKEIDKITMELILAMEEKKKDSDDDDDDDGGGDEEKDNDDHNSNQSDSEQEEEAEVPVTHRIGGNQKHS